MNRPLHKRLLGAALPLLAVAAMVAAGFAGVRQTLAAGGYDGHTVLINELCAKNLTGLTTAAGTAEDWVELLNVSGRDIDLSGWGLSDDPDRPYKWTFPAGTTLSGGGKTTSWCCLPTGPAPRTPTVRCTWGSAWAAPAKR